MASTRKKRIRRSRTARGGKMINKIKTMRNRNVNYAQFSKNRVNRVYENLHSLHNVGLKQQIETFVEQYPSLSYDQQFNAIQAMVLSAITPEHRLEVNQQHANEAARLMKEHIAISAALQLSNPPSEMTYGLKEQEILELNKKKQELDEKIASNHILISPEQGKPIFEILKFLQKRNNYLIVIKPASIADDAITLEPINSKQKKYIVPTISELITPITNQNVIFLREWIDISRNIIRKMKEKNNGHITMYELSLKAAFVYHQYMKSMKFVRPNRERANQFSDREIAIKDAKITCYRLAYAYYEFLENTSPASNDAKENRVYLHTFLERLKHDRQRSVIPKRPAAALPAR